MPFGSGFTSYPATVVDGATHTKESATTNLSDASYVIKLGGGVDDDGLIPLSVESNPIVVSVTA